MNKPLISVIVPVYNVAPYIDKCVDSIVKQTYKKLEIILIDDGSIDESGRKCEEWGKKDGRIKVIHTENFGVSHARNIGLNSMNGDYVSFVDGDDWLELDMYEVLLKTILNDNSDLAGCGYTIDKDNKKIIPFRKEIKKCFNREEILEEIYSLDVSHLISWELCDKLFKTRMVSNIRLDESIGMGEDMLFFWMSMKKANKFSYIPVYKYNYRMRSGSATHSVLSDNKITLLYAIQKMWENCQEESKTIKKIIFERYLSTVVVKTREMMVLNKEKYNKEIIKNQEFIRKYMFRILIGKNSKRVKLGSIFFCMPNIFCRKLINITNK